MKYSKIVSPDKLFFGGFILVLFWAPLIVFAANDVTFSDGEASIVLPGNGLSYTFGVSTQVNAFTVNTNDIDFTLEGSSVVNLTSTDRSSFTVGSTDCTTATTCTGTESTLTITCGAGESSHSVTVTPGAAATCTAESSEESSPSSNTTSGTIIPVAPPVVIEGEAAIDINAGDEETDVRTVVVELQYEDAELMAISEDPTFTDGAFEPYQPSFSWVLSTGNGEKTVYAKLRTAAGGEIIVSDSITLAGEDDGACPLTEYQAYKTDESTAVYYITTLCTKRPFARANVYFTYFDDWSDVEVTEEATLDAVPDDTLGFMPWGPLYNPASGSLIKTPSDPKVYLLLSNTLYHIDNEEAAEFQFGPDWATWVEDVDDRLINTKTTSETTLDTTTRPDTILLKYTDDPKVYQLQNHMLHWIPDEETFLSLGFRWDRVVTIDAEEVYEFGPDLEN